MGIWLTLVVLILTSCGQHGALVLWLTSTVLLVGWLAVYFVQFRPKFAAAAAEAGPGSFESSESRTSSLRAAGKAIVSEIRSKNPVYLFCSEFDKAETDKRMT